MHNANVYDYRDHRPLALAAGDLWENHGWMVWGSTEEEHVLLWVSPYRLVSRPDGPFAVRDAALSQTLFLTAPKAEGHVLGDNSFVQRGWSPADHLPADSLRVDIDPSHATWTIGKREFVATPPDWRVVGEHGGVDVDLDLSAVAPAFWFTDRRQRVEEIEERWFVQCASAQGRILAGDRAINIDGQGCHERHVHCGRRYDPSRLLSARGVTWHSGGRGDIQVLVFTRPSLGLNWSRLILPEGVVDFSEGHICSVSEVAFWTDPRSRLSVPSSWDVEITGPAGALSIRARALSRAYYLWPQLSRGATVLYWWLAEADIRYELTDGRSGELKNVTYVVHDNRLLYRDFESADWEVGS